MSGATYDPISHRYNGLYFQAWREYRDALYDWLSGIKFRRAARFNEVKVMYGTPERAHARLISPQNNKRVELPIISFFQNSVSADRNRQYIPDVVPWTTIPVYDSEGNIESWQRHFKSIPYDLNYTVTLWYKRDEEMQQVEANLLWRFTPISYVYANGALSPVYIESISDSSDLEVGPSDDRAMRRTYSIRVDAWLPLPYEEFNPLSKINVGMVSTDDFSESIGSNELTGDTEIDALNSELFDNSDSTFDIRIASNQIIPNTVPDVITYEYAALGGEPLT